MLELISIARQQMLFIICWSFQLNKTLIESERSVSEHTVILSLEFLSIIATCMYICTYSVTKICDHFYGELRRITREGERTLLPFSLARVTLYPFATR